MINQPFIDLYDASAVNTIIECIVRNTPIIVNKLPAVVEYLGINYPLYFKDIKNIPTLLKRDNIINAHRYLKNMDKTFLTIETFISDLQRIITSTINSTFV